MHGIYVCELYVLMFVCMYASIYASMYVCDSFQPLRSCMPLQKELAEGHPDPTSLLEPFALT